MNLKICGGNLLHLFFSVESGSNQLLQKLLLLKTEEKLCLTYSMCHCEVSVLKKTFIFYFVKCYVVINIKKHLFVETHSQLPSVCVCVMGSSFVCVCVSALLF